jgi:hypothetical protein
MITAFISGHRDATKEEFQLHYIPPILAALNAGAQFVVADYEGVDAMAQEFLHALGAQVTVYHMGDTPRVALFASRKGGFFTDEERDAAMTCDSRQDIAWIRPGKEFSGTAQNLARRKDPTVNIYRG